ncbi:DNA-binding transcriptional activator BglJ [Escherichia coli]
MRKLFLSLNGVRQATDRLNNQWYINQSRTLSPTEREILRFMSRGYSMTQIAEQLKRNIKTIRAHKFNVMSKLGVSSDAGLLEAADILLCMRHCETSNVSQSLSIRMMPGLLPRQCFHFSVQSPHCCTSGKR